MFERDLNGRGINRSRSITRGMLERYSSNRGSRGYRSITRKARSSLAFACASRRSSRRRPCAGPAAAAGAVRVRRRVGADERLLYLAIDRLPLGTAVAIEFRGPIFVAALGSRTRLDFAALALGVAGVLALADVHLTGSPGGFVLAAGAGVFWAAYIVLGHRVAADRQIRPRDGLALAMAIGAVGLAPALAWSAVPALVDPVLLAACLAVGVASSVVPYALEQIAVQRLARARFALLLALLPATAAVIGALVLGQVPGAVGAVGIALVVAAPPCVRIQASSQTHEIAQLPACRTVTVRG